MPDITYALASNGVYAQSGGNYVDSVAAGGGGSGVTVIEDWEGTTPLNNYRGDTGDMSIVNSPVNEGSNALAFQTSSSANNENVVLWDTAGTTVVTDKTYKFDTRTNELENISSWQVLFAAASDTGAGNLDAYIISVDWGSPVIEIREATDGSHSQLASTAISVSANTWYTVSFSVDTSTSPNTIKAEITDDSSTKTVSAQDDTRTSGDHGMGGDDRRFGTEEVYHDHLRKTADTPL